MPNVYGRRDFAIIGELIEPRTRVLDLGCGEGELLAWLKENKQVDGRGVEMEGARVQKAIARGASVYQGDLESAVEDYPDQAFDYVILSQTLQETRYPLAVLRGMLRVGKRAIVAFPNFGHYSVRLAWLLSGRAPRTDRFPVRLVRFAEHPFPVGAGFRSAGAEARLESRTAHLPGGRPAGDVAAEPDGGDRGV